MSGAKSILPLLREEARPRPVAVPVPVPVSWSLHALQGRLTELSAEPAGAPLTFAFRLVLDAQRHGEPAAWVAPRTGAFFPPDVAAAGIDLAALPVVWAAHALEAARAADLLVRSGGFGLVVVDLGPGGELPLHAVTRLSGLALRHAASVLVLTEKKAERASLSGLVSLRAHAARVLREGDRYRCTLHVLKDKRGGKAKGDLSEVYRGPDGLR
jgi:recombination protein RecA